MIKHYSLRKNLWICERVSLETFSHSKTAISFNILLVLMIRCLRNIYFQVSNYICIYYTINAVSFYHLWYGTMYKRQDNDKTLTLLKIYVYASEQSVSELRKFLNFYIIKVLFFNMDWEEQPFTINILKHILRMHKHDFCGDQSIYTRAILSNKKLCMHDFCWGGAPGGHREFVGGGTC